MEIYLQATGTSSKPDAQKVGLLLNHIGDRGIEIYRNFHFTPTTPSAEEGGDPIPGEDRNNYDTVVGKFDAYFTKRDPQLMLREKFWLHLKREPGQSFDSWVNTVRERANECKFPKEFHEQAIRDKLTFSCTDDHSKLKLYDQGAELSLEKAIQIVSLKEATNQELQESKSAKIDAIRPRKCGYCNMEHAFGKKFCPAAKHTCEKCKKIGHYAVVCRSSKKTPINQVVYTGMPEYQPVAPVAEPAPTFIGSITNESVHQKHTIDPGWHVKLHSGKDELTWCIDTGAQVSVIPESVYKPSYGKLSVPDRELLGAGDTKLDTVGCVDMTLSHGHTQVKEKVYVVRGTPKLLLGIPAIHSLGLIHEIPGTYTIRVVEVKMPQCPLKTKEDIVKAYPKLFTGLGQLKGEHTIRLREDAKPFCLTSPRRVPLPLLGKLEKEITRLALLDVIEPVEEPTDWCAPVVVVPKPNGDIRMCVDLTKLNQAVKRELYQMPTVESTLGSIEEGAVYSKLDANSGFHQVLLDPDSRKLTTFITPFGRFMFKRLPYGISSAPEYYQKRMIQVLKGLPGVKCLVDDILVVGRNQAEHDERLRAVLDRLVQEGITLNLEKCLFSVSRLEYLGQIIDGQGLRKDPSKVQAIVNFPEPRDVKELRRFLGMVNQLMKFCPDLAEHTKPLRDLLRTNTAWLWGPQQAAAFNYLKKELASERVLSIYNLERETVVSADASNYGLGAVLLQKQPSGELKPVAYASRSMTDTECRYAQIEKEALALTWALEHWRDYLLGMPKIKVETDHKPLVPLFNTKLIDELPLRIQRFRMRSMQFNITVEHVPGKSLYTADALSRGPQKSPPDKGSDLETESDFFVNAVMVTLPASDERLDEIRRELKKDDTLKVVMRYVQEGWPVNRQRLYGPVRKYWSEKSNLSVHNDLLLRGRRLVIPEVLRPNILRYLHDAHQGIAKTRENAASSVWWPGLSRDIEKMVRNCNMCSKYRHDRIKPMRSTPFPDRPWGRVAADFFEHKGHNYLLVVDYYSRDVEICLVSRSVNTAETILKMKKVFSRHGICDTLFTDNGPQFSSGEFKQFATLWGFEHVTSSSLYAQSNGEVERAVQTMKAKLNKCDDEYLALLSYRDTPQANGYSPAQLSMGRKLKTRVPCHPDELLPKLPDYDEVRKREKTYREKMAHDYNHRHRVVDGEQLSPGDRVWIPDLRTEGQVVKDHETPRSVIIDTPKSTVRRNRRMVRKLEPQPSPQQTSKFSQPLQQVQSHGEEVLPTSAESLPEVETLAASQAVVPEGSLEPLAPVEPRRSERIRRQPRRYIEEC